MNTKYLEDVAEFQLARWAGVFKKAGYNMPAITLHINNRLKTRLGYAKLGTGIVSLSSEMFWEHTELFCSDIIPHEIAHHIAWEKYGDKGHQNGWKSVMRSIRVHPKTTYPVRNSAHDARKIIRAIEEATQAV